MSFATGAFAATLILLPALLRWWWARGLMRQIDDPALPERLLANQRRNQIVLVFSIVPLIFWHPVEPVWAIPALVLARAVVGYPFRRRLYGETWSLGTYLWFFTRLLVGVYGFWLLLIWTPVLAARFGAYDWLAGLGIGALLVAWNDRAIDVLRWILRARPIADPVLLSRFEPMARIVSADNPPRFEYVDLGGGAVANAVALPSLRRSGTLFSSTLLALLDRDEIMAICAHELAHLEYYNPRWLRRAHLVNLGLIAVAAASATIGRLAGPTVSALAEFPTVALIAITMIWRAKDRQKNETASDLRAVALCGDADALARGLTKLYTFARIPRRWDAQRERQATHPSLARRIRDIRAASGVAPAPVDLSATFGGVSGQPHVTFTDTRVEWRESEGVAHTLGYDHLSELRVHAGPSGPARLIAVEKTGRRWEMPLGAGDVASVQAVLDTVDGRLASVTAPSLGPSVLAIAKYFCVTMAFAVGQITCASVILLSALRPGANLLVAAAAASFASSALALRESNQSPFGIGTSAIMAGIGCALLLLARSSRRDDTTPPRMRPVVALAVVAALLLTLLGLDGLNPVRLHQNAAQFPAAAIVTLALAGALIADRRRSVRLAGIAPAVLGAIVAGAGSLTFLDHVARDPFLVAARPVTVQSLEGAPSNETRIDFDAAQLRLSADGRALAVQEDNEDRDDPDSASGSTFHIGQVGGPLHKMTADDIVFIGGDRALALRIGDGTGDVREFSVADPETVLWREAIPDITSGTLRIARGGVEWSVLGWTRARSIVNVTGRVGSHGVGRLEWTTATDRYAWVHAMAAAGRDALVVDTAYQSTPFRNPLLIGLLAATRTHTESRLWHIVNGERTVTALSRLDVQCAPAATTSAALVCAAFDGTRTRIVTIDAATARVSPEITLPGRFRVSGDAAPGWLAGWLDSSPLAVRLATHEALRVPQPPQEWITAVTASDGAIATVSANGVHSTIRIYPRTPRSAQVQPLN